MATHIFDAQNRCIGEGRNLRIMFDRARRFGGVARVTVDQLPPGQHWGALVNVFYVTGHRACTNFADYSHACKWARDRSALSPRVSFWAGCAVECNPWKGDQS